MKGSLSVKLVIASDVLSPDEITRRVAVVPTNVKEKAAEPGRAPRSHLWSLTLGAVDEDLLVDDLLDRVVDLGDDAAHRIAELVDDDTSVTLRIVQDVPDGDEHRLVGLVFDLPLLRWCVAANALIDVDQYFGN